ncbi:hypothetical protein GCM10023310_54530 [Paenibacillus vulneris]
MLALKKEPFHWQVMIKLAIHTGLRRGELLALEWKHVEWEKEQINVLQSVSSTTAGVARVKEPKTKKSKRKVGLSEAMLELLREYQRLKAKSGKLWRIGRAGNIYLSLLIQTEKHSTMNARTYGFAAS